MKIHFIDPPFEDQDAVAGNPSLRGVLNVIPSLGLAYVAAAVRRAGWEARITDATLGLDADAILARLAQDPPDVVGLTATTPTFRRARAVAEAVRRRFPRALLVLGGAHIAAAPEHALSFGCFDAGVLGEAEETFVELLRALDTRGRDALERVPGLAFWRDGALHRTETRSFVADLDGLAFPARDLLPPLSDYSPTPASYQKLPLATVMSSRGCPSKCTFCDRSVFGMTYRYRSPENVVDELEHLVRERGAREIRFFDDTFTLNPRRLTAIFALMKERGLKFPWTCLTKAKCVTRDLLKAMKEAGCWQVLFGLESGDPEMLSVLGKGNTVQDNEKAVGWAHEAGLSVRGDFIVGAPGDTLERMERTLRHALDLKLEYAHFNKFVPYPGTELYRRLVTAGLNFDFDAMGSSILDSDAIHYVPDGIDRRRYRDWLNDSLRRFYLRPSYIARRAVSLRSLDELRGQVRGFFAIAGLARAGSVA